MTKAYPTLPQLMIAMALSVLSTVLTAQVYQTSDENGNPVFSDTPSSGASEVEIQTPNTAASVEVRPQPSQPKQVEPVRNSTATPTEQTERVDPYLIHSDRDDKPEHRPENRPHHPSNQPARVNRPATRR